MYDVQLTMNKQFSSNFISNYDINIIGFLNSCYNMSVRVNGTARIDIWDQISYWQQYESIIIRYDLVI